MEPNEIIELLSLREKGRDPFVSLVCEAEITRFSEEEKETILPLLWRYIMDKRHSDNHDELVACGSAIRKYMACMPAEDIDECHVFFFDLVTNCSVLCVDLQLEVAKMAYNNCKAHLPKKSNMFYKLTDTFKIMVIRYVSEDLISGEGKHGAAASCAMKALFAMRSEGSAEEAWEVVDKKGPKWFKEIIADNIYQPDKTIKSLKQQWGDQPGAAETFEWIDTMTIKDYWKK